jgi:hypothetical protein
MFSALTDRLIASIISIGTALFPFMESIEPNISGVRFNTEGNAVVLSLYIDNCYTEQLNQVISSGQTVTLHYQLELYQKTAKKPVRTMHFFHRVRYNLLENHYEMYCSETDQRRFLPDLLQVHKNFTAVARIPVLKAGDLTIGQDYFFRLSAYLENIAFVGEEPDLDLMFFWNNKRPSIDTETFNSSIFLY